MFFKRKRRKIITVQGLRRGNNAELVKIALEDLVDISKAKVNLDKKEIIVSYDSGVDDILLTDTISKIGLIVTGIKEL